MATAPRSNASSSVNTPGIAPGVFDPVVSVYAGIKDTSGGGVPTPVRELLHGIRSGRWAAAVEAVRGAESDSDRRAAKGVLLSPTWSGLFSARKDAGLVTHSGLVCLDFDLSNESDRHRITAKLKADPHIFAVFRSPGGSGVKALLRIPADVKTHRACFRSYGEHINEVGWDAKCQNESRVNYVSHDPDLFIRPDPEVWDTVIEAVRSRVVSLPASEPMPDDEVVGLLIAQADTSLSFAEGSRNDSAFRLACWFNRAGTPRGAAEAAIGRYASDGFDIDEIRGIVRSAYAHTAEHGTSPVRRGVTDVLRHFDALPFPAIEVRGSVDVRPSFWGYKKSGAIEIHHLRYKRWLMSEGIGLYAPPSGGSPRYVRVSSNVVREVSGDDIKRHTLDYLHTCGETDVFEHMAGKPQYFGAEYLNMLDLLALDFRRDPRGGSMIYYEDTAISVTASGVETVPYADVEGHVWQDHILPRPWRGRLVNDDDIDGSDWGRFLGYIAGDADNASRLVRAIGYMLHTHRIGAGAKMVVLMDQEQDDNPQGGTGKGLIGRALGMMRRRVVESGKTWRADSQFAFQRVNLDTQIFQIDDFGKRFDIETIFPLITEGATVERKNRDPFFISVENAPKVLGTTNYAPNGKGGSFERRLHNVALSNYFGAHHTPEAEFGHALFDEWDDHQWGAFDLIQARAIQTYLRDGLAGGEQAAVVERRLRQRTAAEFLEWAREHLVPGVRYYQPKVHRDFVERYKDFDAGKTRLAERTFYGWCRDWGDHNGWESAKGKDANGGRWMGYLDSDHRMCVAVDDGQLS